MRQLVIGFVVAFMTFPVAMADQNDFLISPRPSAAPVGGNVHLLGNAGSLNSTPVVLVPGNPAITQVLETPMLLSVAVPKDATRTYFLVTGSILHSWSQIASSSPYFFGGALRFYVSSSSLPSTCTTPGQITFGIGHDIIVESAPSAQPIARGQDRTYSVLVDRQLLAELIVIHCGVAASQASPIAEDLIKDASTWEVSSRIRVRSVEEYEATNSFLAVFGD